jgi:glucoamylase
VTSPLDNWIEQQYRYAAGGMRRSISAVGLVKTRPGFGQVIRPQRGSVIASPILGAYDPDPDYFFHWYRDSAVVMDALRVLFEDRTVGSEAVDDLDDFVRFSGTLQRLDGRQLVSSADWRRRVTPDFERHLRAASELAEIHGERVAADTRVNPDATLDLSKWARPQNDGPPLRAIALLRWLQCLDRPAQAVAFDAERRAALEGLLRDDLAFAHRHWRSSCFDVWEEENGLHYFTLRVAAAALTQGAEWLAVQGDGDTAHEYRRDAEAILQHLDQYWLPAQGYYRSRVLEGGARSAKELDVTVILAAVYADGSGPRHSVHDPRQHATLAKLEALFTGEYPINHRRAAGLGVALGRYPDDRYFSGNPWYLTTLGAAEFCFRGSVGAPEAQALRAKGDAFLETVRAYTPASGDMSEQFDRATGTQLSAKQLAWSYAAFITCIAARNRAAAQS